MRRPFMLLAACALLCALIPVTAAPAQDSGTKTQPQVVEPKPGEAIAPTTPAPDATTPATTDTTPAPAVTGPTGPSGPTGVTGPTGTTGPQGVAATGGGGDDDQWLAIAGIVLGVILIASLIVMGLWRWRAWDPRWHRRWRHASAEANWRLSLTWAEFRDFLHLGR